MSDITDLQLMYVLIETAVSFKMVQLHFTFQFPCICSCIIVLKQGTFALT
jgi:hypothetical protein